MPVYRVPIEIQNTLMPSSAYNIWHLRTTTSDVDPGPALDALNTWYSALTSNIANGTTFVFPDALVDVTTQEEKTVASKPAPVADFTATAAPVGMAYVVSWKTSIRARRGRGRTFIGPLTQVWGDDGRPGAVWKNTLTNACNALIASSTQNTNGWAFGVYGRQTANVPSAHVLRDFTGFSLSDKMSHLRSRRD